MSVQVELEGLTGRQQALLVQYACACHTLSLDEHNQDALRVRDEAERQLIEMGIHPCYEDEDDCFTYIFG